MKSLDLNTISYLNQSLNTQSKEADYSKDELDLFNSSIQENLNINEDEEILSALEDLSQIDQEQNIDEENAKDGVIDPTSQGSQGDCWLLSSINALSYCSLGQNIIKNALEYHDGYTTVHLAVGDYEISDEEFQEKQNSRWFSSGDEDMTIIECAVEHALDDYADGKYEIPKDMKWWFKATQKTGERENKSSTYGGFPITLFYLLTGKIGKYTKKEEAIKGILSNFEQNQGQSAMIVRVIKDAQTKAELSPYKNQKGYYNVLDIEGKLHKITENHTCTIKNVGDYTVTFTNPWHSGEDVTISRNDFMDLFDDFYYLDLED